MRPWPAGLRAATLPSAAMKPAVMFLVLVVAACGARHGRKPIDLRSAVETQNQTAVVAFKKQSEKDWSDAWALIGMRIGDIDHYKQGVVLEWQRPEGDATYRIRHESFTLEGRPYIAGEEVRQRGQLLLRAGVYFTDAGQLLYRDGVRLAGNTPDFYELEIFRNGALASVYRSKVNFGIRSGAASADRQPTLTRVPADAALAWGQPSPDVEALRAANRQP